VIAIAVIGLITYKRSASNPKFVNRYYVDVADLAAAKLAGTYIVNGEKLIFSQFVTIYRVHVWVPNAGPNQFDNTAYNIAGVYNVSTPLKSEICAEITWNVENSYPHYKKYRVQVQAQDLIGQTWTPGYQAELQEFVDYMDEAAFELCTRDGAPLSGPTYNVEYEFQQLSKRWYNRAPQE
jgi:hypothetical protein